MTEVVAPDSLWLPPRDARLLDPAVPDQKIPTPLDEWGFVDIPQLIEDVKDTVDPAYQWPLFTSVHHFYWPEADYQNDKDGPAARNPAVFRDLAIHKGLVPRVFENWLHLVTWRPDMPAAEVIAYRIEAWNVAKDLFKMARRTIQTERLARRRRAHVAANPQIIPQGFDGSDVIGEEVMQEVLEKNFRGVEMHLARQERIPREFRLLDTESTPDEIASHLGKLVMPRSLQLVRAVAA